MLLLEIIYNDSFKFATIINIHCRQLDRRIRTLSKQL